jgi:hypothetical protein
MSILLVLIFRFGKAFHPTLLVAVVAKEPFDMEVPFGTLGTFMFSGSDGIGRMMFDYFSREIYVLKLKSDSRMTLLDPIRMWEPPVWKQLFSPMLSDDCHASHDNEDCNSLRFCNFLILIWIQGSRSPPIRLEALPSCGGSIPEWEAWGTSLVALRRGLLRRRREEED